MGRSLFDSLKLEELGLEQHCFEQIIDTFTRNRRDGNKLCITSPVIGNDFSCSQFILNTFLVRTFLINLVYRNNHWCSGTLGVLNRFLGLWHNAIISSNDKNNDIRRLGPASSHRCKCSMTWCINKTYFTMIGRYAISTNMLRDPTSFTINNLCIPHIIKQRCLAMINMTHDCNHRGSWACFAFKCHFFLFQ